ncbi:MAG: hypothetical protein KGD70_00880 [Candidatus Lokiarchaeota archaeon]|nr:hypothetical protein [Candidatus Lokiarchaeota archaeon]
MSKFDRHKKVSEEYIYPHKHCKSCDQIIEEGLSYCPDCYQKLQDKKEKKWYKRKKKEEN